MKMFKGCSKMYYQGHYLVAHYPIYIHLFENHREIPFDTYTPRPINELKTDWTSACLDLDKVSFELKIPPLQSNAQPICDPTIGFARNGKILLYLKTSHFLSCFASVEIYIHTSHETAEAINLFKDKIYKFPIAKLSKKKRKLVERFIVNQVRDKINPPV